MRRLRGLYGHRAIHHRLCQRNVSAVGNPDLEIHSSNYFVPPASCTASANRTTCMSWSAAASSCSARSVPWLKVAKGVEFEAFMRIPPFTAACPPSGGSREKCVLYNMRVREDADGCRRRVNSPCGLLAQQKHISYS